MRPHAQKGCLEKTGRSISAQAVSGLGLVSSMLSLIMAAVLVFRQYAASSGVNACSAALDDFIGAAYASMAILGLTLGLTAFFRWGRKERPLWHGGIATLMAIISLLLSAFLPVE